MRLRHGWWLVALTLLALAVRSLRLGWQPLWWDEGYSVYFATEPLARMAWLTARDIHPPLYYAALHGWFSLFGSTRPEVARLLSVLGGAAAVPLVAWLAQTLQPQRPRVAVVAALLLAISPMHLFYSQEVRMYGPALVLTLAATIAFWRWVVALDGGTPSWRPAAVYIVLAALALGTLYYTGFLLGAHWLWAAYFLRRTPKARRHLIMVVALILLSQLPWWAYTLPRLLPYIADKVIADHDLPLPLWTYLWRHVTAFAGGHLMPLSPAARAARLIGVLSFTALGLLWLSPASGRPSQTPAQTPGRPTPHATAAALGTFALAPLAFGYVVNLRMPFFPIGGERLLLTALPYLLLAVAWGLDNALRRAPASAILGLPLLASSVTGIATFYSLPRYVEHDYRPIVAYTTQHGRDHDTVAAIFPWQIGYWRAYGTQTEGGGWLAPQPWPLDQDILVWDTAMAARLDRALEQGTVWFPAPLSFGSSLPGEIEGYLGRRARSAENRWFSPATRLSAWVQVDAPPASTSPSVQFDGVTLAHHSVAPTTIPAANVPVAIDLTWETQQEAELHVSLRLVDDSGYVWAHRDYEPLGHGGAGSGGATIQESLAFLVPAGLPEQRYSLALGVGPRGSDQLLPNAAGAMLTPLADLRVTQPTAALSPARLPVAVALHPVWSSYGARLWGHSGVDLSSEWLAGTSLPLRLFVQKTDPPPDPRVVWVGLRDQNGSIAAAWQGWTLPNHPFESWPAYTLMQLPVPFDLPPMLEAGSYRLEAALISQAKGAPPAPATLASIQIDRRPVSFTPLEPAVSLPTPVQVGTHAALTGYTVHTSSGALEVELDWEILQSLLPAHDIFVHLISEDGALLGQDDGPPMTAAGPAPSGSWLPGEHLRTQHTVRLAAPLPSDASGLTLRVGLYEPRSQVRLAVLRDGTPAGDSIPLPLDEWLR